MGFEPTTNCLKGNCSTTELLAQKITYINKDSISKILESSKDYQRKDCFVAFLLAMTESDLVVVGVASATTTR